MSRHLVVVLSLFAASAPAIASPWDEPRTAATNEGDVPLFVIPRAFSVTWEPGVETTTSDSARAFRGPDVLIAGDAHLERIDRIGAPRMHSEEYRLVDGPASPREVAEALARLDDVRVAAPLYRLSGADAAPWRAVTSDVLLQLDDPAFEPRMNELAQSLGLDVVRSRPGPVGQWVLQVQPNSVVDPVEAAMQLREQSWVRWSQVDWIQPREERYTPSDDRFPDQWHHDNTGQVGGVAGNDVNTPEAWDLSRGDPSAIVGVLDSGVELDHDDLEDSLLPGYDFVDGDNDPSPNGSHGTSVAGAAAAPENGIGVVGTCPLCSIIPIRVIGANDSGEADAHIYAVDNGAWVINNSWGPPDSTGQSTPMGPAMQAAVEYAMESGRGGLGTAIFWAAGNGHPNDTCDQDGFAAHDDVIAVGASNAAGERSNYSELCDELDISSPSADSGMPGINTTRTGNGFTTSFGGTSAASPVAAGVGAIVLNALPDLTAAQLQALLEATAQKIDLAGGDYDNEGHSRQYGWGRVDAAAALQSELAFLSVSTSLAGCANPIAVSVSIPNGGGDSVLVTASSGAEPSPESFRLEEASDGFYEGVVELTLDAPDAGDGFVSVGDLDTLVIASADSETSRSVTLDCEAPVLSAVSVDEVTDRGGRIRWVTNEFADGRATFDGEEAYNGTLDLSHQVYALDLDDCTAYRVDLESADALGNVGLLPNAASFTTLGDPAVLPGDAPEGADPCDPTTWSDETPEPTPTIQQPLTSGDNACDCVSSIADASNAGWMAVFAIALARRRRA
jgi:hypothetical protein